MVVRSAVTLMPLLVGFVPGVTFTVRSVELPGGSELGLADPVPEGFVGARTVKEMVALPVREFGLVSVIVTGSVFGPPLVPFATVALKEKTLSSGVTSPLDPSLKNC